MRILFLHHSTGEIIWNGRSPTLFSRVIRRVCKVLNRRTWRQPLLPLLFKRYNEEHAKDYQIEERSFPKAAPYGWNNYPFDYYNIWVKHGGARPFLNEPTLELLTPEYDVIMFKHCFPVSNVQPDTGLVDVDSGYKCIANYKRQYLLLRDKFSDFPNTKFIVWTGAARVESQTNTNEAKRFREFVYWVINDWDSPDDNIFVWDFHRLQTLGQLFFQNRFAQAETNSHPNSSFAAFAARRLFDRMVDILETGGMRTTTEGHQMN